MIPEDLEEKIKLAKSEVNPLMCSKPSHIIDDDALLRSLFVILIV